MKITEPDLPTLELYLSDLETVVRKIDAMFFEGDVRKAGKPYTKRDYELNYFYYLWIFLINLLIRDFL